MISWQHYRRLNYADVQWVNLAMQPALADLRCWELIYRRVNAMFRTGRFWPSSKGTVTATSSSCGRLGTPASSFKFSTDSIPPKLLTGLTYSNLENGPVSP